MIERPYCDIDKRGIYDNMSLKGTYYFCNIDS